MSDAYFRELQIARQTEHRHKENRGRLAVTTARFVSEGQGSFEFEDPALFGCTYIEKPWVSYGAEFDTDAWEELSGLDPAPLPLISGMVTDWAQDSDGYYVGAYVAVRVHFPDLDPDTGFDLVDNELMPVIDHLFRFEEIALKSGQVTNAE